MIRTGLFGLTAILMASCASGPDNSMYPMVMPVGETEAVASDGDAADDPAVWVNAANPTESLVLGTDKQAGLYVYDLTGAVKQFLPSGLLNNVDLRQNVSFAPGKTVDLAAATNRSINGVTLFEITNAGEVTETTSFPVPTTEPYGLCVGYDESGYRVFVTYKTGEVEIFTITSDGDGGYTAELGNTLKFATQLEGCSYDEVQNVLFVGEEAAAVWRVDLQGDTEFARRAIDRVGSTTGLIADVEGVDIWRGPTNSGYLVASAQEGNRYIVYERAAPNRWVGTFSITDNSDGTIDGTSHTDGLTINSSDLGGAFSSGILVVQDDDNDDTATQNFKFVSWNDVIEALSSVENMGR